MKRIVGTLTLGMSARSSPTTSGTVMLWPGHNTNYASSIRRRIPMRTTGR